MSQRERTLAILVGVAVVLWAGTVGLERFDEAKRRNEQVAVTTQGELSQAKAAHLRGENALARIRDWQTRSLPTDLDIAKSFYQDWLRQELIDSGLAVRNVREQSPRVSRQQYQQATFIVSASGTLDKLVGFLYRFYQAKHLHRISAASLIPNESRTSLEVSLTVDALSLPNSDRTNALAEGSIETFAEPAEALVQELTSRNIFVAYRPPAPPPVEKSAPETIATEEPDQEAAATFITGMTLGSKGWQISIRHEGDWQTPLFPNRRPH